MKSNIQILISLFQESMHCSFPLLPTDTAIEMTQSTQDKFGHYQCNSAMKLSKILQQNPRKIAETLIANLADSEGMISKLEIAGPGFINITLDPTYLSKRADFLLRDPHLGIDFLHPREKVIIDFSSPNVAKEMHVGHLRSTIIGDSLARLFEFLGYHVIRLNHIGDWGTAFGMLIAYMKKNVPDVLSGGKKTDLPHLMGWYKAAKKQFDEDPEFKRASQLEVVALQQGDPAANMAWQLICEISRKAYQEIYALLDVKVTERGESFYNPFLAFIVDDLQKRGLVEISDGAQCIFLEGFQNREGERLPLMIQKADGGYNYATTDMAAMYHRLVDEKADRIIIVTDSGQATHFQMIFKAAERAGYLDRSKVRVDHVPFGLVLGPDGKKFKTRSGDTERLIDLLEAAVDHAEKILLERNPEMDSQERKRLARALGIGAVKYADLSCNRVGDYVFSYDRMLKFEGNTAAFLMYSYVRIAGIKRKIQVDLEKIKDKSHIHLEHPSEIALGIQIIQFGETLDKVADELLPNRLTDYLYTLAEKFNAFFRDCHVAGTPQQDSRLLLCELTARIMRQGLDILGLPVVDKM